MFSFRCRSRWQNLILAVLIFSLSSMLGCGGPKKGTVTGKITYRNEPLGNGNVVFIRADGKGESSPIGPDGTYKIVNVPAGPVKITVETIPLPQASANLPNMPEMPSMGAQSKSGKYVPIPNQYTNPNTTKLTYEVVPGNQQHDIPLND